MKKIKLGEVLDVKRGPGLSGEFYAKSGDKIRLTLGNFNYPNGGFKKNTSKDDIYFTGNVKPEYILHKGDIITPLTEQVRGLLGSTATIPEDDLYIQNGDVALVIPNEKLLDKRFSYYLISSPIVKAQLDAGSQQTKIRHTSPDKIKDCIAIFPEDINIQKKIAKIADDINNKIEINNQINSELEALAKTLYDYWFLQFEFPNKDGRPYKSSGGKMVYNEQLKKEIPEGWEVTKISNLSKLISGYPFKTENFLDGGKYKIYTIKNVQDGFIDNVTDNNIDFIPKDINKDCVLSYGDLIMSLTGNVGRVGLVFEENALLNQRVLKIKPIDGFFNYIYLTFRKNAFKNIMQRIAGGTSQKNLSPNQVGDYLVVKPNKQILALFNDKLNGFFDSFINNLRQNQELTKLRDFLLPLLMNGQVTILGAEQQVNNTIFNVWNAEKLLRFAQWKQMQGYAARGEVDEDTLMKIFDAMDKDAKK